MDLIKYIGKKVRVDLANGFFYEGMVINCDDDSIEIRDRNNNLVTLKNSVITFVREVSNG